MALNLWIKSLSDKNVDDILVAHNHWHVCCLFLKREKGQTAASKKSIERI